VATPTLTRDPRELMPPDEFAAVARTVHDNNAANGMDQHTAELITAEALKFLAAIAQFPNQLVAPSRTVDEGWHALILHTAAYDRLCDRLGGKIHHYPESPDPTRWDGQVIARSIQLIRDAGYCPDTRLWGHPETGEIVVAASCQHSPPDCQVSCMNKPG
jgi:hypothetical protein